MEGGHHPLTHIYPNLLPQPQIPRNFVPLHTAFDVARLPPIPRILDLQLSLAARNVGHPPSAFPNVMELAFLGDTVLKTIIVEKLQELANCGKAGIVADLSGRLNQNVTFSYLCLAYQLLETKDGRKQKVYADVFEAYFGALWRESNDLGKAHIRMVVRGIFSPEVFPVIAEWQAGRRHFDKVGSLNAAKKFQRFATKKSKKVTKAIRGIRAALSAVKVGGRSREQSVVLPRGMPPILSRSGVTKAKRLPALQIGRRSASKRQATSEIIDLTLDEDGEEEDDDDIVCLDDLPVPNQRVNGISPNAEAGRSRIPEVFIDVNPSLHPKETDPPARLGGIPQKRKREENLQRSDGNPARSTPPSLRLNPAYTDEIDEIFAHNPSPPRPIDFSSAHSIADDDRSLSIERTPSPPSRQHRASSDMVLTPSTLHPIRLIKPSLDSSSRPPAASPLLYARRAASTDDFAFSDTMQSPTVMTRSRRRLDDNVQAAIAEMGLGDEDGSGLERRLDQNMQAAIAEMGLGDTGGNHLEDDTVDSGKGKSEILAQGSKHQSDKDSDLGLGMLFEIPAPAATAVPNPATAPLVSPSSSDMVLTPITARNPFSPRSVPDWIAHFSPAPPAPPLPSSPLFTALRLGTPAGPSANPKLKPARSPLRLLGDVFGSVRSRVEAAFKKKEVLTHAQQKEAKKQKKAKRELLAKEAERLGAQMVKDEEEAVLLNSQSGGGDSKHDVEAVVEEEYSRGD